MPYNLKIGSKVEINRKQNRTESDKISAQKREIHIYYSVIVEVLDQNTFIIQAPIEAGRVIPLSTGTVYQMDVIDERAIYRADVEITKRFKTDNLHLMEVSIISKLEKCQRREYFRMNCLIDIIYTPKNADEPKKGIMLDLSGGGIKFSSTEPLKEDLRISIQILADRIQEYIDFELEGMVLDSTFVDSTNPHYQNRVCLVDLSREQREKIIKFIFEEERKKRKNERI